MASVIYNSFKAQINGGIDWDDNAGTNIKVMLVTSAYTPDIDLHEFKDDITNEVTGTSYTAGGQTIANRSVAVDTGTDLAKYDGDNVVWSASTITARGAVVYKDTGTPATSPLIAYIDFGVDKVSTDGDFSILWSADGIFKVS